MSQNRPRDDGIFAARIGWIRTDTLRLEFVKLGVNSEKPIFMKCQGSDFIIHGLYVDNMMHVPNCDKLCDEFLQLYRRILK